MDRLSSLTQGLISRGSAPTLAARQALGAVYRSLVVQATNLAYIDAVFIFALVTAAIVPLGFIMQRVPKGRQAMGH
jgi:hypothetical protein